MAERKRVQPDPAQTPRRLQERQGVRRGVCAACRLPSLHSGERPAPAERAGPDPLRLRPTDRRKRRPAQTAAEAPAPALPRLLEPRRARRGGFTPPQE